MADYVYKGQGHSLPNDNPGMMPLRKRLDIPDLIANGGLALAATPNTAQALPTTGFAATDTLEIFRVPKGTVVRAVGNYVVTGEGATCTIDIGLNSALATMILTATDNGWGNGVDIETAAMYDGTITGDGFGNTTYLGQLFIIDGAVVILFNNANTNAAIVDFWAEAYYAAKIDA